jgi:hypothetical protein
MRPLRVGHCACAAVLIWPNKQNSKSGSTFQPFLHSDAVVALEFSHLLRSTLGDHLMLGCHLFLQIGYLLTVNPDLVAQRGKLPIKKNIAPRRLTKSYYSAEYFDTAL